ncbi:glycosyltransferase family 4 protein [Spirosoma rhododendri]|uniref:Glycosyltransferase family 4 protein n=1 Tax=Spirosoma rhododendri TaxID=2728024 RepID=A0A7L5DG03_9BACT|nr:glycosyltransferase family 4 protein [Spirosoma rhododendri]QJD77049.1 glycosyltransferase family 4 protein [Spirosoma rhododendri]
MKKIAFIVQRYGVEVNGGAEYHCRILAERLTDTYEVDVLTSCAIEYQKWSNWYPAETVMIHGVRVRRFATAYERQSKLSGQTEHQLRKLMAMDKRGAWGWLKKKYYSLKGPAVDECLRMWPRYQGPYTPELIEYLRQNHQQYDALIFFTYLYYPTIEGLTVAPHKSILIPTAHDEKPIYLPIFPAVFHRPRAILYNTVAEQRFVNQLFANQDIHSDVVGVGIEPPHAVSEKTAAELIGTDADYLLYVGRIDKAKGCDVMIDQFLRYKKKHPAPLKLVLVGQSFMDIPGHPDIIPAGFVDEDVKARLLLGAKAMLMPSPYESLSMVTLESMSVGVPVIANANCEILLDHIEASHAGYAYRDYAEFETAIDNILTQDISQMAENGKRYVQQNYTWQAVLEKFDKAVDYVSTAATAPAKRSKSRGRQV